MDREKRIVDLSLIATECLAVVALASTGDVVRGVLAFFIVFYLGLSLSASILPRNRALPVIAIVLGLIGALVIKKIFGFSALETAAQTVLFIHLAIFLLPGRERIRYFRFGNTFVITSLAAGLSPEFQTGIAIVAYFIGAFVTLVLQFVFDFSKNRLPELRSYGLVKLLLGLGLGIVAFISLTAIVFPLIPRVTMSRFVQQNTLGKLGFSGEVDLQSRATGDTESVVALRIQMPANKALRERLVSENFLRAQVLEIFDGRSWHASNSRHFEPYDSPVVGDLNKAVMIIREPIEVPQIPAFYGSQIFDLKWNAATPPHLNRNDRNVYRLPMSGRRRVFYYATLPDSTDFPELATQPTPVNSAWPKEEILALLNPISQRIFKKGQKLPAKVASVLTYFKRENFQYSLLPMETKVADSAERLRNFLQTDRAGHCELFATTAALLLRINGIPTRLAAGFRIPEHHGVNYMVLRNSDAHVWVEAWDKDASRWVVFDPTPESAVSIWSDMLQDAISFRDDFATFWYRFVVDAEEIQFRKIANELILLLLDSPVVRIVVSFLMCCGLLYYRRWRINKLRREFGILPTPNLLRLRNQIDHRRKKWAFHHDFSRVDSIYQQLRFNKIEKRRAEELFAEARQLLRELSSLRP
jgi:protein-glutamine gamma-glutamyltransferase